MTFRRGLGWVPDPPASDEERAEHRARIGALSLPTLPEAASLARAPLQLDQGDSEACTAHWAVQALWALSGFQGSPWVPWWLCRATDAQGGPIENVGVSAYAVVRTLEKHGIPPLESWRPGVDRFSYAATPPALARLEAQRHRLEVTPIWEYPVNAVCSAIVQGLPVGIVVEVDDRFEHPTGGLVLPEQGPSQGQHMLPIWGYRTADDGTIQARAVNQWGPSWGDHGSAWLSEERLRSAPFLCVARLA